MSVTCLFSPNKLIDYFPALRPARVNVHVLTRYLRTSVKQTITFAPLPYPSSKKALSSFDYKLEAGAQFGAAKNETRRLSSPSIANLFSLYRKDTFDTLIPVFTALFSLRTPFSRSSVSRCGVSTNTGTASCLHCYACLSCSSARLCSSERARSRSFVQC